MGYTCPVCGFDGLDRPPRSPTTGAGSLEICPCCSFQFGVTDDDEGIEYAAWRRRWIDEGMEWDNGSTTPPSGWDPWVQVRRVTGNELPNRLDP